MLSSQASLASGGAGSVPSGFCFGPLFLGFLGKDDMTLKSRGPIPLYYESLYGKWTLNPFRVHFVPKVGFRGFRVSGLKGLERRVFLGV